MEIAPPRPSPATCQRRLRAAAGHVAALRKSISPRPSLHAAGTVAAAAPGTVTAAAAPLRKAMSPRRHHHHAERRMPTAVPVAGNTRPRPSPHGRRAIGTVTTADLMARRRGRHSTTAGTVDADAPGTVTTAARAPVAGMSCAAHAELPTPVLPTPCADLMTRAAGTVDTVTPSLNLPTPGAPVTCRARPPPPCTRPPHAKPNENPFSYFDARTPCAVRQTAQKFLPSRARARQTLPP